MSHTRVGPAAVALLGLGFIAFGAAIKTGFIQIRRGNIGGDRDSVVVRTGSGDVEIAKNAAPSASVSALPTPKELASDSLVATPAPNDSNAVRPTPEELAQLASDLTIPVVGVEPKDLLDTFDEARGSHRHNALDIPAPKGTPVISATPGRVLRLFTSQAGGLMVYTSDPTDRFVLLYGHLDHYVNGIADGMPLQKGDTIGYVGTTGNAPPNLPHLHFGIARTSNVTRWWTGIPVDPRPLLRR
jgi:murein DD-endopeptidase MepM/ murein hydrolase activator NlpD